MTTRDVRRTGGRRAIALTALLLGAVTACTTSAGTPTADGSPTTAAAPTTANVRTSAVAPTTAFTGSTTPSTIGGSSPTTSSEPTTTSETELATPSSPPTSGGQAQDGSEFCQIFRGLSARKDAKATSDGVDRYGNEAEWSDGVATVERIAASAPAEIRAQAATYVQLVKARKDLAASYDYAPVPQDAKMQFGRAHAAMQRQANELIAYAKAHCTGVT